MEKNPFVTYCNIYILWNLIKYALNTESPGWLESEIKEKQIKGANVANDVGLTTFVLLSPVSVIFFSQA